MDAVEYVVQKRRLCKGRGCSDCVIEEECRMAKADHLNAERMVEKVEQWAKEHPVKTRQSEFLKKWPNARVFIDGILDFCPQDIDKCYPCQSTDIEMRCQSCRRDYWLQEVD